MVNIQPEPDSNFDVELSPILAQDYHSTICEVQGIGLHSGVATTVRIIPADAGAGRYFVRVDLPTQPQIPAHITTVSQTKLSTELTANGASVRTVEHLLAALTALGIEDVRIEIDGAELPLLDGSAQEIGRASCRERVLMPV